MRASTISALSWALTVASAAKLDAVTREKFAIDVVEEAAVPLEPRFFQELDAQRVKLRYGPMTAPSAKVNMGMKSFYVGNMTLPCRDCYITGYSASLEFPDGSYANANTSMWLHHLVMVNRQRTDPSCPSSGMERLFGAGNERGAVDLTADGSTKVGYYIAAADTLDFVAELMNQVDTPRDAYVTMDWEFIPAAQATGFRAVHPVWLDVDGACGSFTNGSEVAVPDGQSVFTLAMQPAWKATMAGDVVAIFSHLHDGGDILDTTANGKSLCVGTAKYGETPGYVDPPTPMEGMPGMDMPGMAHISSINWCQASVKMAVGDAWSVTADYNLTAHPAMAYDGKPVPIMGIGILFIALS